MSRRAMSRGELPIDPGQTSPANQALAEKKAEIDRQIAECRLEMERLQVQNYKQQTDRDKDHNERLRITDIIVPRIESARRNVEILFKIQQSMPKDGDALKTVTDMMMKNIALLDASLIDRKA